MTFEQLATSPALAFTSFVLGVISLIAGFVFFFKGRRERYARYQFITSVIVQGGSDHPDGLTFAFKGIPQQQVAVTKILFWNAGRETIRRSDMTNEDPLKLTVEGVEILDAQVVESSAASCVFTTTQESPVHCRLDFDYLDYRDYAILQIVHNGDGRTGLSISGKILGGRGPEHARDPSQEVEEYEELTKFFTSPRAIRVGSIALGVLLISTSVYQFSTGNHAWYVWTEAVVAILFLLAYGFSSRGAPVRLR